MAGVTVVTPSTFGAGEDEGRRLVFKPRPTADSRSGMVWPAIRRAVARKAGRAVLVLPAAQATWRASW